ncbi:MAG: hypothetical protein HZB87_10735 [Desulfatitalea sp.]|nr:hypothetical protein [Desulfatitalea sp.]
MAIDSDNVAAVSATNASKETRYSPSVVPPKTAQIIKNEDAQAVPAVTTPSTDRILINELEGANEEIRVVARQIREVDHTMEVISQNLEKMSASLEIIVKNYPPYLQDSKERVTALRQFVGLRQMIDQLTFPPPDDSPAKILGDSKQFAAAGDWELSVGKGHTPVTIRHQPVHSGADGLDLPELMIDSPDPSVHKALSQMAKSHEVLRQRRFAFAEDANRAVASFL